MFVRKFRGKSGDSQSVSVSHQILALHDHPSPNIHCAFIALPIHCAFEFNTFHRFISFIIRIESDIVQWHIIRSITLRKPIRHRSSIRNMYHSTCHNTNIQPMFRRTMSRHKLRAEGDGPILQQPKPNWIGH